MRLLTSLAIIATLAACSGQQSNGSSPKERNTAPEPAVNATPASNDPFLAAYPQTQPDGSPLDQDYCLGPGSEPASKFDNAKTCFVMACRMGDQASCRMAATYNGNLSPTGKANQPGRLEGMDYFSARKIILRHGWEPVQGTCEGGGSSEDVCREFPEIGNCQGTGIAFCDMRFRRDGRCLDLVTTGGPPDLDGPGDTHVDSVAFLRGPCSESHR